MSDKPNILIIMSDEHAPQYSSIHGIRWCNRPIWSVWLRWVLRLTMPIAIRRFAVRRACRL